MAERLAATKAAVNDACKNPFLPGHAKQAILMLMALVEDMNRRITNLEKDLKE